MKRAKFIVALSMIVIIFALQQYLTYGEQMVSDNNDHQMPDSIPIISDEIKIPFDLESQIINDRIVVPMRAIFESIILNFDRVVDSNLILMNEKNIIEWRFEGHEFVYPYKGYERKYIEGVKTSETRYTGTNKTSHVVIQDVLVVNKTYSLLENFNPGESVTARKAFNLMQADAKLEGLNIYISSGFRSYSHQTEIYNRYVKNYGQSYTDAFSARPGHSEHQTGFAFDLNTISDSFANTEEGKWVKNNCYKYGFIIRHPKGKESITGYQYEPWHIRFIGIEMATKVYNSGLCLEEYLGITSLYN